MNTTGPTLVIEDDLDDQEIMQVAFKALYYENDIIFFEDGEKTLEYLINTKIEPVIIFSDINLPKLNGVELREKIHNNEELTFKSIPYIFLPPAQINHDFFVFDSTVLNEQLVHVK